MIGPIWHEGGLDELPQIGQQPLVWYVRLDDPLAERSARLAMLSPFDWLDFASRPDAAARAFRRKLSKALLSSVTGEHSDEIVILRTEAGALHVGHPIGWHISVAGQWPHCVIGVGRQPLGVDIEPLDASPPPDDAMTAGERLELSAGSSLRALHRWTAKEAHAKLFGAPAQLDPAAIDARVENDAVCVTSPAGHSTCYVRNFRDTVQAVAVHGSRR